MRCENYNSSCFLLHHCRGDYSECPYGRSSKNKDIEAEIHKNDSLSSHNQYLSAETKCCLTDNCTIL